MHNYKTTIAIPTHYRNEMLEVAIQSCLNQVKPVAIVVSDNTKEFNSQCLKEKYKNSVIFYHRPHLPDSYDNFFTLPELIETDYCFILADDDVVVPDCSKFIENAFEIYQSSLLYTSNIIYSKNLFCWNDGLVLGPGFEFDFNEQIQLVKSSIFSFLCLMTSPSPFPGIAFRTKAIKGFIENAPRSALFAERSLMAYLAIKGEGVIVDKRITAIKHDHQNQLARVLLSKKLPDHETKETMKYILGLIENEFFTEKEGLLLSKCYRLSKHWQGDLYFNILKAFEIGWVNNILKHFHVSNPQEKQKIGLRIMNKIKMVFGS